MASAVGLIAGASNGLQAGSAGLSLISATKALISSSSSAGLPPGISGFLFDIPETETVQMKSNITDHYIETNSAIQDHIALAPITITLTGIVSDIVVQKSKLEQFTQQILDRLTPLGVLSPQQSQSARQALNEIQRLQSAAVAVANQFNDVAGLFSDNAGKNSQQKAYSTLEGMFLNRKNLSVETPWKTFTSMAVESCSFSQKEDSKNVSYISITLKQIRTVSALITTGTLGAGRRSAQASENTDKGTVKGASGLKKISDKSGFTKPGSGL